MRQVTGSHFQAYPQVAGLFFMPAVGSDENPGFSLHAQRLGWA